MKNYLLVILASLSFYGAANACSTEAIKTAQELSDQSVKLFEAGVVSKTDSLEAKAHLLEMQTCQLRKQNCKELVQTLDEAFKMESHSYAVGTRTMPTVLVAHTKLVEAQEQCK